MKTGVWKADNRAICHSQNSKKPRLTQFLFELSARSQCYCSEDSGTAQLLWRMFVPAQPKQK